jgi:hypothetical protein
MLPAQFHALARRKCEPSIAMRPARSVSNIDAVSEMAASMAQQKSILSKVIALRSHQCFGFCVCTYKLSIIAAVVPLDAV